MEQFEVNQEPRTAKRRVEIKLRSHLPIEKQLTTKVVTSKAARLPVDSTQGVGCRMSGYFCK